MFDHFFDYHFLKSGIRQSVALSATDLQSVLLHELHQRRGRPEGCRSTAPTANSCSSWRCQIPTPLRHSNTRLPDNTIRGWTEVSHCGRGSALIRVGRTEPLAELETPFPSALTRSGTAAGGDANRGNPERTGDFKRCTHLYSCGCTVKSPYQ